jgi:hypothetical protein
MAHDSLTLSVRHCHLVTFAPENFTTPGIDSLATLFDEMNLAHSICADELVDANVLERLIEKIGPPREDRQRKGVFLCGAYLEEQIAFSAQYMLATGYETYLIRDLIVPRNVELAHLHDQRWIHAGAIVTTLQQLIYEWTASETDIELRKRLSSLKSS